MRYIIKKMSYLITFLSILILSTIVSANNKIISVAAKENPITDEYKYSIYPGDDEWNKYNANEKTQMLQIPEKTLQNLTTEALVKVVAAYPYLSDMFYYDTYEAGFEAVRNSFNGLDELMKREDAAECLIEYYEKIDFREYVNLKEPVSVVKASNNNALEVILAQLQMVNTVSSTKSNEIETSIKKNMQDRIDNKSTFYIRANCYYEALYESLQQNQLMINDTFSSVTTPKGTVIGVYIINDEWTIIEKISMRANILTSYPNVTILNDATKKYNCHAYAWASKTNIWMEDPSAYWQDGSYIYTGPSVTSYAQKVTYPQIGQNGITHTAHSSSYDGSIMWSKWGSSCLVEHSLYDCPYGRNIVPPYTIAVYKKS